MAFIVFIKVNVIADAVLLAEKPSQKRSKKKFSSLSKSKRFTNWFDSCLLPRACLQKYEKICVLPY